ncbi:MAG: hypothetical protein HOY78_48720 [Saccharothrix sp.]|nr:hypothetical protein [Saccharothrix sp.]
MYPTRPTPPEERAAQGRLTLVMVLVAAAVFGLLSGCGAGLRGFELAEPFDFAESFNGLAWISTTIAPVAAWTFVGTAALVGVVGLTTRGFRKGPRFLESAHVVVGVGAFYALVPVALLLVGPFVVWPVLWFESGFGTCLPPTCQAVPAVP